MNSAIMSGNGTWFSTARLAPARCFSTKRAGRACTGGAVGVSGHSRGHADGRGQRDQPRTIQIEGLRHFRAYVVTAAVSGHAQHRADTDTAEAPQFLLQHDAVAVAAGQRDPRDDTRVEQQRPHQRGREVGLVLMFADQHRVAARGQNGGCGGDVVADRKVRN